jgi:hypothetical protein
MMPHGKHDPAQPERGPSHLPVQGILWPDQDTLLIKFAGDDRCSRLRQDNDVSDFKCNEENGALESASTS